jgi:hypothetical protein
MGFQTLSPTSLSLIFPDLGLFMIVIAANHLVADSARALHWDPAGP